MYIKGEIVDNLLLIVRPSLLIIRYVSTTVMQTGHDNRLSILGQTNRIVSLMVILYSFVNMGNINKGLSLWGQKSRIACLTVCIHACTLV